MLLESADSIIARMAHMRVPCTPPFSLTLISLALATLQLAHASDAGTPQDELPILLEADRAEVRQGQSAYAEGNVQITQGGLYSESDWVKYNLVSGQMHAGDRVKITQNGDVLVGSRLDMAVDERIGELENPEYTMSLGTARGTGKTLFFEGQDKYRVKNGSFTTCAAGNDDWYMHASELNLDYVDGVGEAWNGWFEFKGVPLAYYPWADFPLNDNRKTGFLTPTFGYSSSNGVLLSTPFYWDIAANYDATITPTLYGKRGLMLGGEFRYLNPSFSGILRAEGIQDREAGMDRYSVLFQHQQQITDRLRLRLNLQKASDNTYFDDFGNNLETSSQTNLPRDVILSYAGDGWSGSFRWETFQTLQSSTNPVTPPYDLAPQINFSSSPVISDALKTSIVAQATDFQKDKAISGWRSWIHPSISAPYSNSYSFITPKLSVDATQYRLEQLGSSPEKTISRTLPMASLDSGLFFEREASFGDLGFIQTLEPRAYYLYVPYKDQSNIPLFDTGEADLTFSRMFMENRFTGHDRINDANDLTLALSSRIFDAAEGIELMQVAVGQRIYFTQPKVGLKGNNTGQTNADSLLSFSSRFYDFATSYNLQYNFQNAVTQRANLNLSWTPDEYKALNLRYLMNRVSDVEQVTASGQWALGGGWYAVGMYSYSLLDHSSLETLAGLEYNAGCWGLRLAAQRYPTNNGEYQINYFAVLELSGLGGVGSNPVKTIQQSIPNYANIFRTNPLRTR